MSRDDKFMVVLFVAAFAVLAALSWGWNAWECSSKARVMGFDSSWGPVQGCAVEYKPGKWIPLERYRAVDDE